MRRNRFGCFTRGSAVGVALLLWCAIAPASAAEPGRPYAWLEGSQWLDRAPVTAAELEGRTVVLEFWTFDCVNCRRTVPAMRALEANFRGRDVVVLGIHTPELEHERDPASVRRAVARLGLRFPVALDNDAAIWRAFDNEAWPALYLLDGTGRVRASHIGELHQGTPGWDSFVAKLETLRHEAARAPRPDRPAP